MGQRQSTHIASSVCDFDHDGVTIDIATDNVRFVGSEADVFAAVKEFCARCRHINFIINELPRCEQAAIALQEGRLLHRLQGRKSTFSKRSTH
jgi:hypothetical protein